ncbi:uncharacterized protein RMCC_3225 [Mycolicibacterium canariasense]|uniref:Uncharacterized protein n=1 Tax=Mycolicibacterium canariasense TaxID=228230 RepID=A0A117IAF9_MYCCR|nr:MULTISPECIES: hypothetical protein [Mycolicibacterium]MDO0973461.1 hypothetical protein [Mycolicibacterium frederiksbergense]ORV06284.1 hypothetical protein AWB94_17175 [Mycolicibacterium canariasense]GAS96259.1 uncharacterized protein RMCC_3225 [Mycolicibacterium canariasense]
MVHDDLAWFGYGRKSGRGVDRRAEDVAVALDHRADTKSRPQQRKTIDPAGRVSESLQERHSRWGIRAGDHHGVTNSLDQFVIGPEHRFRHFGEVARQSCGAMIAVNFGVGSET